MKKNSNYQQALFEWKKNQILLRRKYADTPAGFHSEASYEEAMEKWQLAYDTYQQSLIPQIQKGVLPESNINCIGRTKELQQMQSVLSESHLLFLYGIGGIGKTTLAQQYMRQNAASYDHILFTIADQGIVQAISDDHAIPITTMEYSREQYKTLRRYYHEKIKQLSQLCKNAKVLIVIDNYNARINQEFNSFLELDCDKIITTRIHQSSIPEEMQLEVSSLSQEDWPAFIRSYCSESVSNESLNKLLAYGNQVDGHTLSLKLASSHILQEQAKGKELSSTLLDFMSKDSTISQPKSVEKGLDETNWDVVSLLSAFHLTKEEWDALLFLSVLSMKGISEKLFLQWTSISDKTITHLQNYLLLSISESSHDYALEPATPKPHTHRLLQIHPLVAEAVRRVKAPTCQNCSKLLRGIENYMTGKVDGLITWDRPLEENRQMEPQILSIYENFPAPAPWLGKAFEEIATFLWIQGYFPEAQNYALLIYEAVSSYYGADHEMPAREALRVAAVYHNKLDYENARIWYQKGYELIKAIKHPTFESNVQYLLACGKLARDAKNQQNIPLYQQYVQEFEEVYQACMRDTRFTVEQREQLTLEYEYALLYKGVYLVSTGDYTGANKVYEEMATWINSKSDLYYRLVGFEEFHISLLIHANQIEEAEKISRNNIELTIRYRGKQYKDYLSCLETLADILMMQQKSAEALFYYEEILIALENDYQARSPWSERIIRKIQRQ